MCAALTCIGSLSATSDRSDEDSVHISNSISRAMPNNADDFKHDRTLGVTLAAAALPTTAVGTQHSNANELPNTAVEHNLVGLSLTAAASLAAALRPVVTALLMREQPGAGNILATPVVVVWCEAQGCPRAPWDAMLVAIDPLSSKSRHHCPTKYCGTMRAHLVLLGPWLIRYESIICTPMYLIGSLYASEVEGVGWFLEHFTTRFAAYVGAGALMAFVYNVRWQQLALKRAELRAA